MGLKVLSIQRFQRYPLSTHLYWRGSGRAGSAHRTNHATSDRILKQNFAEHLEILRLFREAPAAPFARLAQRLVVA